jgi:hypothetical protein
MENNEPVEILIRHTHTYILFPIKTYFLYF